VGGGGDAKMRGKKRPIKLKGRDERFMSHQKLVKKDGERTRGPPLGGAGGAL